MTMSSPQRRGMLFSSPIAPPPCRTPSPHLWHRHARRRPPSEHQHCHRWWGCRACASPSAALHPAHPFYSVFLRENDMLVDVPRRGNAEACRKATMRENKRGTAYSRDNQTQRDPAYRIGRAHDCAGSVDQIYCFRQWRQRHLVRVSCGIEICDHHVTRPRRRSGSCRPVAESRSTLEGGGGGGEEGALEPTGRDKQAPKQDKRKNSDRGRRKRPHQGVQQRWVATRRRNAAP